MSGINRMEGKRVAKNALWIISCKIVQSVLALVITMLTARYLGPSNFGLINYAASIVAFATPIMQLGLTSTLVQELVNNKNKDNETLGSALCMNFACGILCIVGVISFTFIANTGEPETIIVCGLYSIQLLAQAAENIVYWFQSRLLSKYQSIVSVIAYVFVSAYKIFLLQNGMSIRWFAVANSIDYFLISVALYIIYKKLGGRRYRFNYEISKKMFSVSKYYILANLMVVVFAQTDKIMIKMMIGDQANGYYSSGVACASLSSFVFTALLDSMRPMIFEAKKQDVYSYEINVKRLYAMVFWLSISQSIVFSIFSKQIITILYGREYLPAANVLRIIIWYTAFSYFGYVRNIWLLAEGKQKMLWKINMSGAIANILLNAILIPYIGINGAALASLATQLFTNVIIGFIYKPLRANNQLMIQSFNPKIISNTFLLFYSELSKRIKHK